MNTLHVRLGALVVPGLFLVACIDDGPQPVPPPLVPPQHLCPAGFGPLGNGVDDGCYLILDEAGWIEGEDACETHESQGAEAHLVVVDREVEHLALSQMAPSTLGGVWIGRFQTEREAAFRNVNFIEYGPEYFGVGEPNDYGEDCSLLSCTGHAGYGDERCIEYHPDTGQWNDKACYRSGTVVCEWDGVPPYAWRPGDE